LGRESAEFIGDVFGTIRVGFAPGEPEPAAEIIHHQINILIIVARDDRWRCTHTHNSTQQSPRAGIQDWSRHFVPLSDEQSAPTWVVTALLLAKQPCRPQPLTAHGVRDALSAFAFSIDKYVRTAASCLS